MVQPETLFPTRPEVSAQEIVLTRRSAQAFDGQTRMHSTALLRMLARTLPHGNSAPWDAWPWPTRVHLVLFVHRVDGLLPGLYCWLRRPEWLGAAQQAMRSSFEWAIPDATPRNMPLYRLVDGDFRALAARVSCDQDIAADGCFSLGMLAEFDAALAAGPWNYRRLFWEAGMIGQVLYLEAEAVGLRGTGIGCYYDDRVHELLGLKGQGSIQSLYHFTVGGPLDDARLSTLPPYPQSKAAGELSTGADSAL